MSESEQTRWQPVLLLNEKRVQCDECGALAVVVSLDWSEHGEEEHTKRWCQDCFIRMSKEDEEEANQQQEPVRFQPLFAIIHDEKRLECECGAIATILIGRIEDGQSYNVLNDVDVWCQACYEKAKEEQNDE